MGIGIILDIIIITILVLSIWLGYKKGLTKSLLKIFSFLIALVVSLILFKPIANIVIKQTSIADNIQNTIISKFKDEEKKSLNIENKELEDKEVTEQNEKNDENIDKENSETTKQIDQENKLLEKDNENSIENYKNIFNKYIEEKIIESTNEAKDYVIEKTSREIAVFIVNISTYIILLIITRIILIFIKAFADLITKIPGIKQCDELLGGVYGGLRAGIIILIVFTLLSIMMTFIPSDGMAEIIDQSIITKFIYENNIIIKIIL